MRGHITAEQLKNLILPQATPEPRIEQNLNKSISHHEISHLFDDAVEFWKVQILFQEIAAQLQRIIQGCEPLLNRKKEIAESKTSLVAQLGNTTELYQFAEQRAQELNLDQYETEIAQKIHILRLAIESAQNSFQQELIPLYFEYLTFAE